MSHAKDGDTVRVHYTGKLSSGEVFDSSNDKDPFEFQIGQGRVISGFEDAVVGMAPGESKTTTIPPDNGYGNHRSDLVWQVEKQELPNDLNLEVGQYLESVQPDGRRLTVKVSEVGDTSVTLDANHPLAGHKLTFDIELLEIV